MSARQLRLVLETADLDAALAFYRDALGLPELEAYQGEDGARVAILGIPTATLELANPAQVALIDEVEVGRAVAHPFPLRVRVAFEVAGCRRRDRHCAGRRGRRRGGTSDAHPVELAERPPGRTRRASAHGVPGARSSASASPVAG